MRVLFKEPAANAPEWLLSNVELIFNDPDDPLCGLRLIGLSVRKGTKGEWVAFPSRKGADDKWHDFLLSALPGQKPVYRLKDWIKAEYERWLHSEDDSAAPYDPTPDQEEETPF